MRALADFPFTARAALRGVLFDIDDTFTTGGRITAEAYAALERLQSAHLLVIPITGRPAGWCDHIARMWPVDAVVGENGALYTRYDHDRRKLTTRSVATGDPRQNQRRLLDIGERILREVPGSAVASDQSFRHSDLAIDYCED